MELIKDGPLQLLNCL